MYTNVYTFCLFNLAVPWQMIQSLQWINWNFKCLSPLFLLLFSACIFCGYPSTSKKKTLTGTNVFKPVCGRVSHISGKHLWVIFCYQQLFFLLVLFLHVLFACLMSWNVQQSVENHSPSKSLSTTSYIHSVWTTQQQILMTKFKTEQKPLVLAGDGRSDSPGHCVKYGSYSVIEQSCNEVLDFKLVQVCTAIIHNEILHCMSFFWSN